MQQLAHKASCLTHPPPCLQGDAVEVHISGYYSPAFEGHEGELPMGDDDEDDEGEDEDGLLGMGDEDDEDEDGEFGEMDEDEEEDEEEDGVLGFGRKPKVVIEEVHEEEEQPKAKVRARAQVLDHARGGSGSCWVGSAKDVGL